MTIDTKATQETTKTQQQPIDKWEELNDQELEKVAGGCLLPGLRVPVGSWGCPPPNNLFLCP